MHIIDQILLAIALHLLGLTAIDAYALHNYGMESMLVVVINIVFLFLHLKGKQDE